MILSSPSLWDMNLSLWTVKGLTEELVLATHLAQKGRRKEVCLHRANPANRILERISSKQREG